MSTPVVMPQLGESVTEGTVTRWLKQVGDRVEADEPLLEVSTDKVDTEIPSPAGGFLIAIAADEDDIVEVGGMLATIGESSEASAPADRCPGTTARLNRHSQHRSADGTAHDWCCHGTPTGCPGRLRCSACGPCGHRGAGPAAGKPAHHRTAAARPCVRNPGCRHRGPTAGTG